MTGAPPGWIYSSRKGLADRALSYILGVYERESVLVYIIPQCCRGTGGQFLKASTDRTKNIAIGDG
jgi:hypothetical protein